MTVADLNHDEMHRFCLEALRERWGGHPATPRQRAFIERHRLEWDGELTKFSAWVAISRYCRSHPLPARGGHITRGGK